MMSSKESETLAGKDLPEVLLYHLLKNNYRWRDKIQHHIPNTKDSKAEELNTLESNISAKSLAEQDFRAFLYEVSFNPNMLIIHPSDVLLNTILRSNLELKQILFQKLFMCKQSVPLIYQVPGYDKPCYSLFPLRSMSMECRTRQGATVLCAATMKSKVVAFVRIGNSLQSKSKLLNDLLSEQKHSTFCHRDVVDENTKRLNAQGLIEAAWFLPSGKSSDPFEKVVTFLNLHGNAARLPNEIVIAGQIASVIVALIDISCLADEKVVACIRNLSKRSIHLIILLTNSLGSLGSLSIEAIDANLRACLNEPSDKIKVLRAFNLNTYSLKPEVTLRKELLNALHLVIQEGNSNTLSECGKHLSREKLVLLDEEIHNNDKGKSSAKLIFSELCSPEDGKCFLESDMDDIPRVTSKEENLPLQGKLWNQWSDLNKKQHKNIGSYSINELGEIEKQMNTIRQTQAKMCSQVKMAMCDFIKFLIQAIEKDNSYPNFLLWLKMILNENSRNVLPDLFEAFRQSLKNMRTAVEKNTSHVEIKRLREVAENAEMKLATASFGLGHFMRELGQLYEASILTNQPISGNIEKRKLPNVMADLLLKGQALEIMDGDAANIPINWIKAVLRQVEKKLGSKKLFIVSVLGIQSSGKSTLLNALFGLQFTVSAGRCTRGVFGQLVPVDQRKNLPYDYIFVIDSEGLRAPELGQLYLDHDNELATFVIGIGDVTLINIKGENTAEMKDILQITVQAFLRMKLANDKMELKRKCIFIHQNVGAVNAEEQMMQGLKKFQENLDTMTKLAAEEENNADIQTFSQVIEFHGEKHVLYFPDLWQGDPPMAPSNPGYSEKVTEVLQRLEHIAVSESVLTNINGLMHRIEDLWNGILAENFVFSFRNTLEIKAYNTMESKYQNLSCEYRRCLMEWFEKEASIEIDLCKTDADLQTSCETLKHKLQVGFIQKKQAIEEELNEYFDKNEMNYILIQWKNSRIIKFRDMSEEVESNTLQYIEERKEEQRIVLLSKSTNMKLEEAINSNAKDLAKTYRGQEVEQSDLLNTFDDVWIKWTAEFMRKQPSSIQPEMVESMLIANLYQRLKKHESLVIKEMSITDRRLRKLNIHLLEGSWTEEDISREHISRPLFKGISDAIFGKTPDSVRKLKRQAKEYTDNVFRKMDIEFTKLVAKDVQIRAEHARDIINKAVEYFESENNAPDHKLTFKPTFKVKVVVYICAYANSKFTFMIDRYEKKHGVQGKLDAYKETAKHLFVNTVQKKSDEIVAADFFCDRVKERVIDMINTVIPRQIVQETLKEYSYSKHQVMLRIMDELVRKR